MPSLKRIGVEFPPEGPVLSAQAEGLGGFFNPTHIVHPIPIRIASTIPAIHPETIAWHGASADSEYTFAQQRSRAGKPWQVIGA
jgi:hypothetical protein